METVPTVILTAVLSFVLTGVATVYSRRRGMLDHPGERHSHTIPTPTGGGAGLLAALLIVSLFVMSDVPPYWMYGVAPGALVLGLTGWWDDHRPLSARFRFLVQVFATLYLLIIFQQMGVVREPVHMMAAALFVLWMANLYNFMDGSDGMAGGQGVFAALVLAWLFHGAGEAPSTLLSLALAACCAGFLPWNLGRARVFMGDVGSVALGFVFAALLLFGVGAGAFSIPVALMVMSVFLADSTLTLLLRVLKGERWYNAHRQHVYQRLIANGRTHFQVLLLYQAINLALVLPAIAVAVQYPESAWSVAAALALALGSGWFLAIKKTGVLA